MTKRPRISGWRKWVFRLAAMTLAPALFFGLLEIGLRVFGYGYPGGFFVEIDGRDAYATNQRFGWRFFPPAIAREPAVCELAADKPADTYRIFVLGGSAAMGTPEPAFAFGRMLEAMLSDQFPHTRFEVVNAAMTAVNSHVVLPIARDCAAQQADLFVVYMGNNEVVGPYGAASVFGALSPNLTTIRASISVKSTRIGQLVGNVLSSNDGPTEWKGMEMFLENRVAADDPRLEQVYGHFRANLEDICGAARDARMKVVVCTVAVNLEDCPPFAAVERAGLKESERTEWEKLYRAGIEAADAGKHAQAAKEFLKALAIDDRRADLHFRLGQGYRALGQFREARRHLVEARDLDALRFRADTQINRIIREVAADQAARQIYLVDAEKAFAESGLAPEKLSGKELFYEHVHMRPEGNYLLAKIAFERIVDLLPKSIRDRAAGPIAAPSPDTCFQLVALSGWERYRIEQKAFHMQGRPPFTNQIDHGQRYTELRQNLQALRDRGTSRAALEEARRRYVAALERLGDENPQLCANYARLLQQLADQHGAAEQWRALLSRFPEKAEWHVELGTVLKSQHKAAEAIGEFEEAVRIDPRLAASAHFNIGTVRLEQGQLEEALKQFHRTLALDPQSAQAHNSLGATLLEQGNASEAMEHFHRAIELDSDSADAHHNLGYLHQQQGNLLKAAECYRRALRADPRHLATYPNLASVLAKLGKPREALQQHRKAAQIAPENADLHYRLANLLIVHAELPEAVGHFREVLRIDPDHVQARHNLAATLAKLGNTAEAIGQYRQVLKRRPDYVPTRKALARILATHDYP